MATNTILKQGELKFQKFDDIKVSTKTIIAATNISLSIIPLYDTLTVSPYIIEERKRGRKKRDEIIDPNIGLPDGSIISIDYMGKVRGAIFGKRSRKGERAKYFRNAVTIIMMMDGKRVNFKVSSNGKFQMTGCKSTLQAEKVVKSFWEHIKDRTALYTIAKNGPFSVLFVPAMRNIDFSVGFFIDREKLSQYINQHTNYYSILEASFGYTGLNVKFPVINDIEKLSIRKLSYDGISWTSEKAHFKDYLDMLSPKERDKALTKKRYTTFLVFQSGKVIQSGMCSEYQRPVYDIFIDIINNSYEMIRERIG